MGYAEDVQHFKVTYNAIASTVDGPDSDDLPDLTDISGTIKFTPNLRPQSGKVKYLDALPPFDLFPLQRRIKVERGVISDEGRDYVMLEAATANALPSDWTWQVEMTLTTRDGSLGTATFSIEAHAGSTVDLVIASPASTVSGVPTAAGPRGYSIRAVTVTGNGLRFTLDDAAQTALPDVVIPSLTASSAAAAAASGSATAAAGSASTAAARAGDAGAAAVNAASAAASAADSANTAATMRTAATGQANAAAVSHHEATVQADRAGASATTAAGSATNAGNSATAAAGSASAATTAATNAGNSATAAAGSASTAATAATNAGSSATAAAGSASTATTAATNAGSSATAAAGSASAAATSRTEAKVFRDEAEVFAGQAATGAPAGGWTEDKLAAAVAAKLNGGHDHTGDQVVAHLLDGNGDPFTLTVTQLAAGLIKMSDEKADLDSPEFTGNPSVDGSSIVLGSDSRLSNARPPTAHSHTLGDIPEVTAVGALVAKAATGAAARTAIGAGTSSLALGNTNTTAMRGDAHQLVASLPGSPVAGVLYLIPKV